MRKTWIYFGDMSIRNGGYFYDRSNIEHHYVDAVRVVPCSDAGGPDNEWWVEVLTVNIPDEDAKLEQVLSVCGWSLEDIDGKPQREADAMVIDACIAYGKYDQDTSTHVRIGPKQTAPGWSPSNNDVQLRGNASLRAYVRKNYLR